MLPSGIFSNSIGVTCNAHANIILHMHKSHMQLKAAVADIPNKPDDDDYFYLRWLRGMYCRTGCDCKYVYICITIMII